MKATWVEVHKNLISHEVEALKSLRRKFLYLRGHWPLRMVYLGSSPVVPVLLWILAICPHYSHNSPQVHPTPFLPAPSVFSCRGSKCLEMSAFKTKDSEVLGHLPLLPVPQWPSAAPTCHKSTLTVEVLESCPIGSGTSLLFLSWNWSCAKHCPVCHLI